MVGSIRVFVIVWLDGDRGNAWFSVEVLPPKSKSLHWFFRDCLVRVLTKVWVLLPRRFDVKVRWTCHENRSGFRVLPYIDIFIYKTKPANPHKSFRNDSWLIFTDWNLPFGYLWSTCVYRYTYIYTYLYIYRSKKKQFASCKRDVSLWLKIGQHCNCCKGA